MVEKYSRFLWSVNDVDRSTGTFKEMTPDAECLEDCQKFLFMGVVVEFQRGKSAGMESHRVDFTRICLKRKYCSQSIVRSISFYNERLVRNPMSEDRRGNKCGL